MNHAHATSAIRPARPGARIENGLWRHSSHSQGSDQTCVEVAITGIDVAVRDSKDSTGPALRFTDAEWSVFLLAVVDGEFDLPDHRKPRARSAISS